MRPSLDREASLVFVRDIERVVDSVARWEPDPSKIDRQALAKANAKRLMIRILPDRIISWDHEKLAGAYCAARRISYLTVRITPYVRGSP